MATLASEEDGTKTARQMMMQVHCQPGAGTCLVESELHACLACIMQSHLQVVRYYLGEPRCMPGFGPEASLGSKVHISKPFNISGSQMPAKFSRINWAKPSYFVCVCVPCVLLGSLPHFVIPLVTS